MPPGRVSQLSPTDSTRVAVAWDSVVVLWDLVGAANSLPRVGPIVICEIMYHPPDIGNPPANNTVHEYIELHNISGTPVQLYDTANPGNTWKITSAVDYTFPANVTIPADGYILIVGTPNVAGPQLISARVDRLNVNPLVGVRHQLLFEGSASQRLLGQGSPVLETDRGKVVLNRKRKVAAHASLPPGSHNSVSTPKVLLGCMKAICM